MKLRNLFMAVVAGAAMLVGCNKEVDLGPAKLALDQSTLAFEAAGGSQTVSVTATRDWAVSGVPDWVALSATSGKAAVEAQPVKITVAQNAEYNRSATIVFTIGFARTALTINQAGPEGEIDNGDGSLENPFNVAGVVEYVNELGADVASPKKVFVEGIISAVDEEFNTQYGNGAFKISDDGSTTGAQFTAYRILYLGNKKFTASDTQIKVGDVVIIYGNVVNYKGNTPETQQNSAFLYSLNGVDRGGASGGGGGQAAEPKGTGTEVDPFNVAAAIAKAVETGETATENSYYIKGKVGSVTDQFNAQYGNATFTMIDAGFDATFTAYRVLYFNNKKWALGGMELKEGDEVVVCAKIVNFKGNTPETSGGYVVSINGESGGQGGGDTPGVDPTGTGTEADPFNVAAAIAKAIEAGETATADAYYIKGKVAAVSLSAQYKNGDLDLVDVEGGAIFKAFRIKGFNGADITGTEPIKVGDEVVVYGNIVNYKGNTPETTQGGTLISWNGQTSFDGGDEPGGDTPGVDPAGTGTAADPFNVAAAIAKAVEAGETATADAYYIKGKVAAVSLSAQYKNGDLDLVDVEGGAVFKAFRIKGFGGADITGTEPIKVGDEVVVYGNIVNYKGNTPETTQGGKLISWNGQTSFDQGGDNPPAANDGLTLETAFTASEAHAWIMANIEGNNNTGETKYYVKGKVNRYYQKSGTDQNFTNNSYHQASFFITDDGNESTDEFEAYQINYLEGKTWEEGQTDVVVGDEVIIYGPLAKYNTTAETQGAGKAYLYSLNGVTSVAGGDEPGGGDQPGGGDEPGGSSVVIKVDFTPVIDALPQGSSNGVKDGTYTLSDYVFTMHAADKLYQAKNGDLYYLLIGKKDSYIELPAIDGKALKSVKFLTGANASENVIIDIAKADGTLLGINTEKNKKGQEYTYTVNGEASAVYRIAVTNAYNAQFQNLELTYE